MNRWYIIIIAAIIIAHKHSYLYVQSVLQFNSSVSIECEYVCILIPDFSTLQHNADPAAATDDVPFGVKSLFDNSKNNNNTNTAHPIPYEIYISVCVVL